MQASGPDSKDTIFSPVGAGFRMPAEWEPHEAVWLSWPKPDGISFPDSYEDIPPIFGAMIEALRGSEAVWINVRDAEEEGRVQDLLPGASLEHVRFFHIPTREPWCRDHGPIFVYGNEGRTILDWGYNAWGGKYPPFDEDDAMPTLAAEILGIPVRHPGMILEGGSIDVNGVGDLLTTSSCLLNPNRNPTMSKSEIEHQLKHWLGVRNILWLGDGIEGDDTDGHVDDITRFVGPRKVLTVVEPDPSLPNHAPLQENLEILRGARLADGSNPEVLELPMPRSIVRDGMVLPASYANFYIGNRVVLLPVFNDPADAEAIRILADCFPGRRIVPIDCSRLIWGLGAFHCLTQQVPA